MKKFWGDKQRALWYVMVFSGMISYKVRQTIVPLPPPLPGAPGLYQAAPPN